MQQLVSNRRRSRRITLSLPAAAHQPIRRGGRIVCRIAILLFGHDEEGTTFTERTHTVMLSLHGAGILSTHRFAPEQELILRIEETSREAVVRVVGEIATEGELHTYAVAFLDDGLDFWQAEFPPAQVWDARPMALPLECGSCGQRAEVTSGQFEYDISQIHGGLTRHCAECGVLTVWRRADGKGPSFERRRRARARLSFFACVKTAQFGPDIVTCLDMSKGGVGFLSRNPYKKEMKIQIAVPYAPEVKNAPSIFVSGRIANVREMDGMWRCGVKFLKGACVTAGAGVDDGRKVPRKIVGVPSSVHKVKR